MKIYTKGGDQGETSLIGGKRVHKCDARVEAYGTVDELGASLGVLRDLSVSEPWAEELLRIQRNLFVIQSRLASENPLEDSFLPTLSSGETERLEQEIDRMEESLPPFTFVVPGGHVQSSHAHLARCICRRAERRMVSLSLESGVEAESLAYVNRLSDYLFVLSRYILQQKGLKEILCREK